MSGVGVGDLHLPPGFRFHPTDDELVTHYLCRKCAGKPLAVPIVADIDLYKYEPWLLPGMALYGEKEWYFFSPRDRKYPNGSRPNRAAGSGYWKATGADKPIGSPKPVAIKKALVFYAGKAPKGEKTNWIMHEYRLADVDRSARRKTNNLRLDDWVLCRIYNKKGGGGEKDRKAVGRVAAAAPSPPIEQKPVVARSHVPLQQQQQQLVPQQLMDLVYFDPSDSVPRLHADSSCSEHVTSPEFAPPCDREVQSRPRWREWERALDFQLNRSSTGGGDPTAASSGGVPQFGGGPMSSVFRDPLDDIFMHLQKPF